MGRQQKSFTGAKIGLSLGFILISVMYAVWQNLGTGQPVASASQTSQTPPATTNAPITITASEPPRPKSITAKPPQKPVGLYADGSYTGAGADAYYGTVQVKAIIRDGKIADVQFLQYPNDRNTSREINAEAMPLLAREAIAAQSARVDGVSGATETSGAFVQSLASALARAKS